MAHSKAFTCGILALVALCTVSFALCCGCTGSSSGPDEGQVEVPATTAAPTPELTEATPEVTEPPTPEPTEEEISPLSVVVHDVERTNTIGIMHPLDGNDFVIVDFTVDNAGEDAFDYNCGLVEVVNAEGYSIPFLKEVTFCPGMEHNDPFYMCTIDGGQSERGKVVFGVPEGIDIVQFNLRDHSGDIIAFDEVTE